jgi:hypothetical protein
MNHTRLADMINPFLRNAESFYVAASSASELLRSA